MIDDPSGPSPGAGRAARERGTDRAPAAASDRKRHPLSGSGGSGSDAERLSMLLELSAEATSKPFAFHIRPSGIQQAPTSLASPDPSLPLSGRDATGRAGSPPLSLFPPGYSSAPSNGPSSPARSAATSAGEAVRHARWLASFSRAIRSLSHVSSVQEAFCTERLPNLLAP